MLPDLIAYDEERQLLIIEALDYGWLRLDRSDLRSRWSIEVFGRVATAVARWHRESETLVDLPVAKPWLLQALDGHRLEAFERRSDLADLLDRILNDPELHGALASTRRLWRNDAVIHGDIRLSNVFFHTDGAVRLIDWETGGRGDARWDVAGLLQELHSAEVQQGISTAEHRSKVRAAAEIDESDIADFVAARLILRAIQLQSWPEGTDALVDAHLEIARSVAAHGASVMASS